MKPPIPPKPAPAPAPAPKTLKFRAPESVEWQDLRPVVPADASAEDRRSAESSASRAKEALKGALLGSLQMQHVVVLAGSGTSLGDPVNGPSMWDLWDHCVNANPGGAAGGDRTPLPAATEAIAITGYQAGDKNIESLLSQCEAYLHLKPDQKVAEFLKKSKETILAKCRGFLKPESSGQLQAHRTFLHRLARRRARDSRVKVFTTNYDLCFETAAARQGLIAIDGFSFTQPREYDPRFFTYDIVRRSKVGDNAGDYVEGIFLLYKLHGSVNWERDAAGRVKENANTPPESACLIYPAKGKYQQSFLQPHLELLSQYLTALREPNTCLIVAGFGFNDDHLSEPILAAIQTNPHLRVIVVNRSAESLIAASKPGAPVSKYWRAFSDRAEQGSDVWFVAADFQDFAELVPDLKSLTPAQRLAQDIKKIVEKE